METLAFGVLWLSLALYAVLAGADFGVGFWTLVSYASGRGEQLRRDAFSYFSPVWEVNTLFLVFFLMGLFTAFSRALGLLGRALIPLVLAALALFVVRAGAYALAHHGPERLRRASTWSFGVASVGAGVLLGYAAAAPASGLIRADALPSRYYVSAVGIAALPLTLAASAHLAALFLTLYAHVCGSRSYAWFRSAAIASGSVALAAAALFTLTILGQVEHTRDRLLGGYGVPMLVAAVLLVAGILALVRHHPLLAVTISAAGYLVGLVGGAYAQLPYVVYPALTIGAAASPRPSVVAFLLAAALGGPLLLAATGVLYAATLRAPRAPR